ncbi:42799_t:CDS:2, partial [Gigaspora margarita]
QKLPKIEDSLQQKWELLIVIQDPEMQQTRECPTNSSAFELIRKHNRRCGLCREIGYNSRTCPRVESANEDSHEDSQEDSYENSYEDSYEDSS